jgi:hypothetical protein
MRCAPGAGLVMGTFASDTRDYLDRRTRLSKPPALTDREPPGRCISIAAEVPGRMAVAILESVSP